MRNPTGEKAQEALKLRFDRRLRLEFQGARITSGAGLLACRELDGVLGLTALTHLRDTRAGRNVQHQVVPLLRQSVYSRLAGYEHTNDADPARSWTWTAPRARCMEDKKGPPTTDTSGVSVITRCSCLARSGTGPGNVHSAHDWKELLEGPLHEDRSAAVLPCLR